jgi:hydrogenase nickel incorporation protein HypB
MVSVTEGDDKPRKYPQMLRAATVWLCSTRSIFCPTSRSILDRFFERVRQLNSSARVFTLSALTGQGMAEWYGWVRSQ